VSSFFPNATLPEDVFPRVQDPGEEKSSVKITSPTPAMNSGVGVSCGVGWLVGVFVGGNHTIVAVAVDVGVCVGVLTCAGGLSATGRQADDEPVRTNKTSNNVIGPLYWILILNFTSL
jgi:hypothetical protein